MLVLSRKIGETIIIDNEIILTVVEFGGKRVRLGIEAPKDISIRRSETSIDSALNQLELTNELSPDDSSRGDWNNSLFA